MKARENVAVKKAPGGCRAEGELIFQQKNTAYFLTATFSRAATHSDYIS
jgi:hypothetical protein